MKSSRRMGSLAALVMGFFLIMVLGGFGAMLVQDPIAPIGSIEARSISGEAQASKKCKKISGEEACSEVEALCLSECIATTPTSCITNGLICWICVNTPPNQDAWRCEGDPGDCPIVNDTEWVYCGDQRDGVCGAIVGCTPGAACDPGCTLDPPPPILPGCDRIKQRKC